MSKKFRLPGHHSTTIARNQHGIFHVQTDTETELYRAMGYCHAIDRSLQMLMMRILGQGRASEFLEANAETLDIDRFFRRMNWTGDLASEIEKLSPTARETCQAYCAGVNTRLSKHLPWELKALGYVYSPWTIEDCLLLSRMTGYLTLAQSQGEMERLLLQMVQNETALEKLEELFPGQLGGLEPELLKKVKLETPLVPESVIWNPIIPPIMASNNWVVSGKKTASGQAILANDPHLEGNRLPNVWYELILQQGDRYAISTTMPGLPGMLLARTPDLAWGATYTFMDAIDSWVEHCQNGQYLYEGQWHSFQLRKEIIRRKNKSPVTAIFYENPHGTLEGNPEQEGYYLTTRWSSQGSGAHSLSSMLNMWSAQNVQEGMTHLGQIETAWNWVLADRHGNIGYQMSGLMPKRRAGISGLVPLPGWNAENDWQGFVPHTDLPRAYNPKTGYFVTANQDLNPYGQVNPINLPMGPYRAERIQRLLAGKNQLTVTDMQAIQLDTYSPQAALYMEFLKPLLPNTPQGEILKKWDCHYSLDSEGAYLFEKIYHALFHEVFGNQGLGQEVSEYLDHSTSIYADFYYSFDRILLSEKSVWFNGRSREAIYRSALDKSLETPIKPWRAHQEITLSHLLLSQKLPHWAGFDRGPIAIPGGRATPCQGQIYRSGGRITSFLPTFRMITDFSESASHTCLLGGPSDRRFSKWYCSELDNWVKGRYKKLVISHPVLIK